GQPAPPAPDTPQPPAATPGNAPAAPTAAPATGGMNCAASAPAPFRDCHCGPPDATWFTVGTVLAWLKPARIPLLATSDAGALLGGDDAGYGTAVGVLADGGWWLDCRHTIGVDLNGFILEH